MRYLNNLPRHSLPSQKSISNSPAGLFGTPWRVLLAAGDVQLVGMAD